MPDVDHWMERAACKDHPDPEAFFPDRFDSPRRALACCERCPVTRECRDHGRRIRASVGVWGGEHLGDTDGAEQQEMRARYEQKFAKSLARIEARKPRRREHP